MNNQDLLINVNWICLCLLGTEDCVKLEALAGLRRWPRLPPCSNTCLVSTGGCVSPKKLSLAGHWKQKGVTGTRGMTSKLLVHFLQAQGPLIPAARWQSATHPRRRHRWEQGAAASPLSSCTPCQPSWAHTGLLQTPLCTAHPQHHLHRALWTSLIFTEGEYAKAPVPKLTPQLISQTSFRLLHVGFSLPFWERDGTMEQQIERMPEMDFLTGVPQFSAQRCDRLGCHPVYFLQHNHSSGMGWTHHESVCLWASHRSCCPKNAKHPFLGEAMPVAQPHNQCSYQGYETAQILISWSFSRDGKDKGRRHQEWPDHSYTAELFVKMKSETPEHRLSANSFQSNVSFRKLNISFRFSCLFVLTDFSILWFLKISSLLFILS